MHQANPIDGQTLKLITNNEPKSVMARKIMRLLDGLKQSETGKAIYLHVQRALCDLESSQLEVQQGYSRLLGMLLDAYGKHLPPGSPERIHLTLMQMRLAPPLSTSELNALSEITEEFASQLAASEVNQQPEFQLEINHILQGLGFGSAAAVEAAEAVEAPAAAIVPPPEVAPPAPIETLAPSEPGPGDIRSDDAFRKMLEGNRARIQRIQTTLSHQLSDAIRQSEQFGVLLELEREELMRAESIDQLLELKDAILVAVDKLIDGNHDLAAKFDDTQNYLKILESDSQQLGDELARVHLLSITDELTDLPNRRAFMRRLEDEIGRVQRYGYPLTVALIDLDYFKAVNDKYGHAGGDEVLRVFCHKVLSIFRHHDMIARYGGEEFAVILPNTDHKGAMHALMKVKRAATNTVVKFGDQEFPLNTFSAGLAMYRPGETPGSLIERADTALYRAKGLGRNRIETEHFDSPEK